MNSLEKYNKIKDYYEKAWLLIKKNDYKSATKVIYDEMGIKLYDIAVDIQSMSKIVLGDQEEGLYKLKKALKSLIYKVDKALCEESVSGFDDQEDQKSKIIVNSVDNDWYNENVLQ
jgi:hypothetical protein